MPIKCICLNYELVILFYRGYMKKFIISLIVILILILLTGFITPLNTKVVEKDIATSSLEESYKGLKIVQISDILINSSKDVSKLDSLVKKINNLNPDVVIFTGDLVNNKYSLSNEDKSNIINYLNSIECSLYKYAIYGDNDLNNITLIEELLTSSNFIILDNKSTYLFYKSTKPIKITGITGIDKISNALVMEDDLETTLNIVLTHYPDYVDTIKDYGIDIVFAGHSLKGQVRIPFYGGVIKRIMLQSI